MQVRDEVCGMTIESSDAAASVTFEGRMYYFCAERCRRKFEEHPDWYVPTGQDDPGDRHH
jgi:YHS domain-containing protein